MFTSIFETITHTFTDGIIPTGNRPSISSGDLDVRNDLDAVHSGLEVVRLHSAEEHRRVLCESFRLAQRLLLIVSPFVSRQAVEADHIERLTAEAVKRGVKVIIVVDDKLNKHENGEPKRSALDAKILLTGAGATFLIADSLHNKTLCVDQIMICEGSYNWLSAVRSRGSQFQRMERSIMCRGLIAGKLVDEVIEELGLAALTL